MNMVNRTVTDQGITLNQSATAALLGVYRQAMPAHYDLEVARRIPGVGLDDSQREKRFQSEYKKRPGPTLAHLEAARFSQGDHGVEFGQKLKAAADDLFVFLDNHGETLTLEQVMHRGPLSELPLKTVDFSSQIVGASSLSVPYHKQVFTFGSSAHGTKDLHELARLLKENQSATINAVMALINSANWLSAGNLESILKGEKFVILGGSAELSCIELLLTLGADVLCVDLKDPTALTSPRKKQFTGTLTYFESGANLLAQPAEISAGIQSFAQDESVHMLNMAYVGGDNREWRLTQIMEVISRSLPTGMMKSVGTFVSPAIPVLVHPYDVSLANQRLKDWENSGRLRTRLGKLLSKASSKINETFYEENFAVRPGPVSTHVANAVNTRQGASYHAAQIFKIIFAQLAAAKGNIRVSANVAPITHTKSMDEALYRWVFAGGRMMNLDVGVDPDFTRIVMGLIYLNDILGTEEQTPRSILQSQVHGGAYGFPWSLESMINTAALYGLPAAVMDPKSQLARS